LVKKIPDNTCLLSVEASVDEFTCDLIKDCKYFLNVQSTSEDIGSILSNIDLSKSKTSSINGSNPYLLRGKEQLCGSIDLTGCDFSQLSSGSLTINIVYTYYSV